MVHRLQHEVETFGITVPGKVPESFDDGKDFRHELVEDGPDYDGAES